MSRFYKPRLLILLICLFLLSTVIVSAQESRYAVVVGNSQYTDLGILKNPVNDANDMAVALGNLGFQVDLLVDADILKMEEAVSKLKTSLSQKTDSIGFFFYAGHGIQSQGVNYLIPSDARIPSESYLKVRALSVQTILEHLQEAHNSLNMVVLDACRDNPFAWARSGTRGLSVAGAQPAGSIIIYATGAGSVAQDGTGRNGVFTSELLKNLNTPGLEVSDLFKKTGKAVSMATKGTQVPAIYSQFFDSIYLSGAPSELKSTIPEKVKDSSPIDVPRSGLIAEYLFNGNARDSTANGNHGIINGAWLTLDRNGKASSAIHFEKNSSVSILPSSVLNFGSGDYTICLWINPQKASNTGSIISKWDEERNLGWNLGYDAADDRFNAVAVGKAEGFDRMYNCPVSVIHPFVANTAKGWEFITMVKNNSENSIKFFINAEFKGSDGLDHYHMGREGQLYSYDMRSYSTDTSKPIIIGYGPNLYGFDTWFRGDVDDVRIFNRALADDEIRAIFLE